MRRLTEVARALRCARELSTHDTWDRDRLLAHQQARLVALVRHAAAHSPYHRERLRGITLDDDLDLASLPTMDKADLLEHFDALVTDRRLTLATVDAHLADLEHRAAGDELLLGAYRAMTSGGTTGRRGVFVYGRDDWSQLLGGFLRWTGDYLGLPPRLPRRRKLAAVVADSPLHMTSRIARSVDVGAHRMLRLDARAPIAELVPQLNACQPEALTAFPSVAALLAEEQLAGRLRISPATIATTSEVRTPDMTERIVAAWGTQPFNGYASTETGMLATDCAEHAGLHLLEDLAAVEVLEDRILVTNLVNRTQPLIRYEITDLVAVSDAPCPCGRPTRLIADVDGRSDDVLRLPSTDGARIPVHPVVLRSPLASLPALRQYRIVHDAGGLTIEAILAPGADGDTAAEIRRRLTHALGARGVAVPDITVTPVAALPRHPTSGKTRLVESRA